MKKWCVVMFLIALMVMLEQNSDITKPVFQERTLNSNNFDVVSIDVSDVSITTKNLTSLLGNLSLLKVEYEIPKLYQLKFGTSYLKYDFENQSVSRGLQEIEHYISNRFKQMGYQKEVERIYFYGIKINVIEVYGRKQEIEAFEQQIKKNSQYGFFFSDENIN